MNPTNMRQPKLLAAHIGISIATLRKARLWNQSELARKTGMTAAAIWQIERGLRAPNAASIKMLCEVLHISADELLSIQF